MWILLLEHIRTYKLLHTHTQHNTHQDDKVLPSPVRSMLESRTALVGIYQVDLNFWHASYNEIVEWDVDRGYIVTSCDI